MIKAIGIQVLVGFLMSSLLLCCGTPETKFIEISNPIGQARTELVRLPYGDFQEAFTVDSIFKLIRKDNGEEVAYQLERLGNDQPQYVLIAANLPADGRLQLDVHQIPSANFPSKAFARYVPERFDDFAWENDRIAFRMYGKALEGRSDDADGTDIWVKRTEKLVVNDWYASGDYHKDHGEGLDYYSVGHTLGAGDVAPYVEGKLHFSKHYRKHQVLDNGPLRTTFRLDYDSWDVAGRTVSVSKLITLDAGSQLNRVELHFDLGDQSEMKVAAGIAKREQPGELLEESDSGLLGYWEPQHGDDGTTGVAVLSSDGFDGIETIPDQYLALFNVKSNEPYIYYKGGAWDKAGHITNAQEWFDYLKTFQEQLAHPVTVSIK